MSYLPDYQSYLNKATVKRAELAKEARILRADHQDASALENQIVWFAQLATGVADLSLSDELREQLLTILVDNAGLYNLPDPVGVFGLTWEMATQELSAVYWQFIQGNPATSAALEAYISIRLTPYIVNPMTTLGDVIYGGASGLATRLAGNTTSTRKMLFSTGSAGLATAPLWDVLSSSDIPDIAISQVTGLTTALDNKLGTALESGKILVGNGSGIAAPVSMSGDATIANTGALTIAANAVSFSKMQTISSQSLLGRYGASTGVIQEITLGSGLSLSPLGVLSATGSGSTITAIGAGDNIDIDAGDPTAPVVSAITTAADQEVMFNNGGVFAGIPYMYYNGTEVEAVDSNFILVQNGNPTRRVWFRVQSSTGFTRVITTQDADGTMAYLSDIPAAGANTTLSNLGTTDINSALLFQTGLDIGSATKPIRNLFLYGAGMYGTTSFEITGTPTSTRTWTLQDSSDTFVGRATTDTLTNKTYDTDGTGNSFLINGVAVTANTGTGAMARAVSPSFTTPDIGAATGTSLTVTGALTSGVASTTAGLLVLRNSASAFTQTFRGTNYGSNIIYDWPTGTPTSGQVLSASAPSGSVITLSWATASGSGDMLLAATQTVTGAKTFNDQTLLFRNPANTFSYTLVHGDIAANRQLNLPVITATDTLAVLGLAQTFSAAQTFSNKIISSITGASTTPAISLTGLTMRWISYGSSTGVGSPVVTTRSAGSKIIFAETITGSNLDFGMGLETNYFWLSTPNTSNGYRFYTGPSNIPLTLTSAGLDLTGGASVYFKASSTAAGTATAYFANSTTWLTTPVSGALEWNSSGTNAGLWITLSGTRYRLDRQALLANPFVAVNSTKTGAYTITTADYYIRADGTSGAFTVTLPTASTCTGQVFVIKKIDSSINAITIGGTVDGVASPTLATQYSVMMVISNGTTYDKLSAI